MVGQPAVGVPGFPSEGGFAERRGQVMPFSVPSQTPLPLHTGAWQVFETQDKPGQQSWFAHGLPLDMQHL